MKVFDILTVLDPAVVPHKNQDPPGDQGAGGDMDPQSTGGKLHAGCVAWNLFCGVLGSLRG
jgi:hypothetical protein